MILANYAQQNRNCVRELGIGFTNPFAQFKPTLFNNFYLPDTSQTGRNLSGFNNGYNVEYWWHPPLVSGGMSSSGGLNGSGTISATALAVKLALADLTGSGTITATGSLIIQALASLTGSGTISDADIQAFLLAVANLTGSGTVTGTLSGLGALIAALEGSGTGTGSILTGIGALSAALTVTGTGLTTANVGEAVWSVLAANNNVASTMGAKLNSAASAGDPWSTALPGSYATGTAGNILGNVDTDLLDAIMTDPRLLTVAKFLGLK